MLAKDFQVADQRTISEVHFNLYDTAGVIASNTSADFDEVLQALQDGLIKLGAGD